MYDSLFPSISTTNSCRVQTLTITRNNLIIHCRRKLVAAQVFMFSAHLRRCSTKSLWQVNPSTRPFSYTPFRNSFRSTRSLRQEAPPRPNSSSNPPPFGEETVRARFGEAFKERVGQPHIRNQVLVSSREALSMALYPIVRI